MKLTLVDFETPLKMKLFSLCLKIIFLDFQKNQQTIIYINNLLIKLII